MEGKKGSIKKDPSGNGWIPYLLDNVFGTIRTFVEGTVESVQGAVHECTTGLMRRTFLFLASLFGFYFLGAGLAEMITVVYRKPGLGGITIGVFTLFTVWVIHVFSKK